MAEWPVDSGDYVWVASQHSYLSTGHSAIVSRKLVCLVLLVFPYDLGFCARRKIPETMPDWPVDTPTYPLATQPQSPGSRFFLFFFVCWFPPMMLGVCAQHKVLETQWLP